MTFETDPICPYCEHEYDEWVRMDIDQKTLDRWSKDPMMEKHSKEEPYSYYSRDCNNCDDTDYSKNVPLGAELAQDQIRSRYDELEAELHLMDGDWLCDKCKATVIRCPQCHKQSDIGGMCVHCWEPAYVIVADEFMAQEDKANAEENKTMAEAVEDLKTSCTDQWEMIKARVFITLFLVWVCFAIWEKYVS